MKTSRNLFSAAAWCMLLFGLIHEATFTYSYVTMPPQEPVVVAMENYPIVGTPTHLYSFYNGYALLMGVLLILTGVINLVLVRVGIDDALKSFSYMGVNILLAALALALSIAYFSFFVPIVLTALALLFLVSSFYSARHVLA